MKWARHGWAGRPGVVFDAVLDAVYDAVLDAVPDAVPDAASVDWLGLVSPFTSSAVDFETGVSVTGAAVIRNLLGTCPRSL